MIRLVRCFVCRKKFFLKEFYWRYDKFLDTYPEGTACKKCSKKEREKVGECG